MMINCDNCGKYFSKKLKYVNEHKHHFCCRKCYHEFRKKDPYWKENMNTDYSLKHQKMLKKWAKKYAKRNKSERNIYI